MDKIEKMDVIEKMDKIEKKMDEIERLAKLA